MTRYGKDQASGSTIHHVQDIVVDVLTGDYDLTVRTHSSGDYTADMVVLATGNPEPSLRKPFKPEHAFHQRIIANPLRDSSSDSIPTVANVLVVGSGLTSLDMLSTLLRRGHSGKAVVISRRGMRPREQSPEILGLVASPEPFGPIIEKLKAPIPEFIAREPINIRRWCRALRLEIQRVEREGKSWHGPFDAVRNVVWKLWPLLPLSEKMRFLRHLRGFYDIHRFRTPPMNEQMVREAELDGQVKYLRASLTRVSSGDETEPVEVEFVEGREGTYNRHSFDYLINCTGLDAGSSSQNNSLFALLEKRGLLLRHPTGLGYNVTSNCEAYSAEGKIQPRIRVLGPATAGVFGDPLGAVFISAHVNRILPSVLGELADTNGRKNETGRNTSMNNHTKRQSTSS